MSALLRTLYLDPRVGPGDPAVAVGRRRRRHHAQPLQGDDRRRARARQDRHAARQVVPVGPGGRRLRRARVLDPGRGDPRAAPGRGARRAGRLRERDDALRVRGGGGRRARSTSCARAPATDLETGGASEGEEEVADARAGHGHRRAGARGSDRRVPAQAAGDSAAPASAPARRPAVSGPAAASGSRRAGSGSAAPLFGRRVARGGQPIVVTGGPRKMRRTPSHQAASSRAGHRQRRPSAPSRWAAGRRSRRAAPRPAPRRRRATCRAAPPR